MPIGIGNDWLGYLLTHDQYHDSKYKYFKTLAVSDEILGDILKVFDKTLDEQLEDIIRGN